MNPKHVFAKQVVHQDCASPTFQITDTPTSSQYKMKRTGVKASPSQAERREAKRAKSKQRTPEHKAAEMAARSQASSSSGMPPSVVVNLADLGSEAAARALADDLEAAATSSVRGTMPPPATVPKRTAKKLPKAEDEDFFLLDDAQVEAVTAAMSKDDLDADDDARSEGGRSVGSNASKVDRLKSRIAALKCAICFCSAKDMYRSDVFSILL